MALFALTNYHELSNEAVVTVTALLLGIPTMHALYLQDQRSEYADKDVWGDYCLTARYMRPKVARNSEDNTSLFSFRDYKWIWCTFNM